MSDFKKLGCGVNCPTKTGFTDCEGEPILSNASLATCADLEKLDPNKPVEPSEYCPSVKMACAGGYGYGFAPDDNRDPAATVEVFDCDDNLVGYIYPTSAAGHTIAIKDCEGVLAGYSANASDCASSLVTISGTLAEGNTIATVTIDGTPTDIKETVTDITGFAYNRVTSALILEYFREDGVTTTAEVNLAPALTAFLNTSDPNTATIFSQETPATVNDPTLRENSSFILIGTDGSLWVWDGDSYVTSPPPVAQTEWNLQGTNVDAGGNKLSRIWRKGPIMVGDGVDSTTTFNGYFLARGDFTDNPTIFAFQNTRVPGTGMQLNNGAGPGQFLPGMSFTPSGALRTIMAVNVLDGGDVGFQEPGMQIRVGKGTGGLTSLTSRPTFEVLNGLRVDLRVTAPGNLLLGTTANPGQERLVVSGALKLVPQTAYGLAAPNATTPVPNGGAGTIVYSLGRFLGWNGTMWKALDN